MKKTEAEIIIVVDASCPHCKEGVNILSAPCANERCEILQEVCSDNGTYSNWGHSKLDMKFKCTSCGEAFSVDKVNF